MKKMTLQLLSFISNIQAEQYLADQWRLQVSDLYHKACSRAIESHFENDNVCNIINCSLKLF